MHGEKNQDESGIEKSPRQDLGREGHWEVKGLSKELVIVPYKITRAGHPVWGMSPRPSVCSQLRNLF